MATLSTTPLHDSIVGNQFIFFLSLGTWLKGCVEFFLSDATAESKIGWVFKDQDDFITTP